MVAVLSFHPLIDVWKNEDTLLLTCIDRKSRDSYLVR